MWRHTVDMDNADVARDIGISVPTLYRLEKGKPVDGVTLAKVIIWLLKGDSK